MHPTRFYPSLLVFVFICSTNLLNAQSVSISRDTNATPDLSALLDLQSTNQGMLAPRLTESQRDSILSPANGLLIYQTDEVSGFYFYNGLEWKAVGGQSRELSSNFQIGQQDENASIPEYIWDPINGSSSYDTSGIIYDSGGAAGDYFDNQDSYFYIFPPGWPEMNPQLGLQMEIISLDVHSTDSLLVVVYDGLSSFSKWYKGNLSNVVLPFGSERALMRFVSDGANSEAGFEVRYDWIYPPFDTTGGTTENLGWFYEPAKMAMRGGIDFVHGWQLDSIGQGSFSFGESVKAVGDNSFAMGRYSIAKGDDAIAIGVESKADGAHSFAAMGGEAEGVLSMAIGQNARARNTGAIAIGEAYADGYQSVALGGGSTGSYTFSAGRLTSASGIGSAALGYFNKSEGDYSFSAGYRNESEASYQTTFGRFSKEYNSADPTEWVDSDPLFVIGNGIGSSFTERSNAFTLLKNGNLGLGVYNPTIPLHIKSGNINSGTQTMAMLEADSTNSLNIRLRPMTGTDFVLEVDGDQSKMYFERNNSLMTLDWNNSGRVGVGTTSPQSKLHVEGTLEVDNTIKANDIDGLTFTTSDDQEVMRIEDSGYLQINEQLVAMNDNGISISTNDNIKRLTISDNGNVGIGPITSTTNSKFYVNGRLEVQNDIKANNSSGITFVTDDNLTRMTVADNGNVGIGTTSPSSKLHIEGNLEIDGQIRADDASGIGFASDEGTTRMQLSDNGRIGIGNTAPDAQLSINAIGSNDALRVRIPAGTRLRVFNNGNVRIGQNGGAGTAQVNINSLANIDPLIVQENSTTHFMVHDNGGVSVGTSTAPGIEGIRVNGSYAAKSGGGAWTATSDIRLKNVHRTYSDGLAEILKINPVEYSYNELSGYDTAETHIGVVAQELKEVAPYMIGSFEQEGEDYLTVDNSAMIYMLINAVKEQQVMIDQQQKQIEQQGKTIEDLLSKVGG
jgi:hypothetical protein